MKDNKIKNFLSFQVKILIPNSTAGMIIGKGGNYIKQIKEESGSYIQLSQKSNDASLQLQERCVTIIGIVKRVARSYVLQKVLFAVCVLEIH